MSDLLADRLEQEDLVEVELHSRAQTAVEATRLTIEGLPGGKLLEECGRYFVPRGFVAWAAVRQGYVRRVLEKGESRGDA